MASQAAEPDESGASGPAPRPSIALEHLRAAAVSAGEQAARRWWRDAVEWTGGRSPLVLGVAAAALVVAIALGGAVLWQRSQVGADGFAAPQGVSTLTIPMAAPTTVPPPDVVVHVAGAVVNPGVYRMPTDGRVGDIVEAAGGVAPDADVDRVNLAAPLSDGSRIYVPRVGEAGIPAVEGGDRSSAGDPAGETGEALVNINTASADALDELPGVGPATAAAIIEHRERRGAFQSVDDLLDVSGIGPAKLEQLRPLARV